MRFVFLLVSCLVGLSCTRTDVVHRDLPPDAALCRSEQMLGRTNREALRRRENPARCFLQHHRLPSVDDEALFAATPGQDKTWAEVAQSEGRDLRGGDTYALSFIEMSDRRRLQQPAQLTALRAHLQRQSAQGRQNYVIAFVHGWRHDAALGDNDLRKFRTLLGYARSALNTRCVLGGTYCDAALTGVFVAWRGRSFAEPVLAADGGLNPLALIAAPTLWDRKRQSESLSTVLGQVLDNIQAQLRLAPGRADADKFLIFGHSLGGNMLADLMEVRAEAAIEAHPVAGRGQQPRAMAPPLGDLVVLINPAAEARKWTSIQQQMREKVGLARADNQLTAQTDDGLDEPLWERLQPWRTMFPLDQRPVYLSITATDNWAGFETGGRKVAYDTATGTLFPLATALAGERTPEGRHAIGHLFPRYATASQLESPAIGTSHELSVNRGTGRRAAYWLSVKPVESWCDPASGWLYAVRQDQIAQGWAYGDAWDYGLAPEDAEQRLKAAENIARGYNPASVQWRHSQNLRNQPGRWSVVSGRSPFWNVRAMDNAVREHGGYVNYPMWCALNQLVLDDVVRAGDADDVVDAMRLGERIVDVEAAIAAAAE